MTKTNETVGAAVDERLFRAATEGDLPGVEEALAAGAGLETRGGADMTPLMSAACGGHQKVVELLLGKGAVVSDDLLASIKMKVDILVENAGSGMVREEAVAAWKGFFQRLRAARLKQDWPQLVKALSSSQADERKEASDAASTAVRMGLDVDDALPLLEGLLGDADGDTRNNAADALACRAARRGEWARVSSLLEKGDGDVQSAAVSVTATFGRDGADLAPMLPALRSLLASPVVSLRHDAALGLGYAATNGADMASAVADLAKLLADPESPIRHIACWAFYRLAKHGTDCSSIAGTLEKLGEGADEKVAGMAKEAFGMIDSKRG